jgi:hypothetical protein
MQARVSPEYRDRYGRKIRTRHRNIDGNPGTKWRRIRDNWEDLKKIGMNPDLGTMVGKLFLFEIISARQASAARLYAEVIGRHDRFHGTIRRTVASPAYERGARGQDDEIEKRIKSGTILQFERMAKRAKKAWNKLQACIPNDRARCIVEDICLFDKEIDSIYHDDLVKILDRVADKFGIGYNDGAEKGDKGGGLVPRRA